jgi:hypothetical protein
MEHNETIDTMANLNTYWYHASIAIEKILRLIPDYILMCYISLFNVHTVVHIMIFQYFMDKFRVLAPA